MAMPLTYAVQVDRSRNSCVHMALPTMPPTNGARFWHARFGRTTVHVCPPASRPRALKIRSWLGATLLSSELQSGTQGRIASSTAADPNVMHTTCGRAMQQQRRHTGAQLLVQPMLLPLAEVDHCGVEAVDTRRRVHSNRVLRCRV